jgi:hypothetical protein
MFQGALFFAVSLFLAQANQPSPAPFAFNWITNDAHRVSVCGTNMFNHLKPQRKVEELFQIHVEPEDLRAAIGLPPISGTYRLDDYCFHFLPSFPFQPGVRYRATFTPPGQKAISSVFHIPLTRREPTTVVTQIYPTADVLPDNLLKFYLYFSASMSGGHIYEHIQLTDEKSDAVELPFLEIDEELWNSDMTRLTLFLDPGRIKRGVKPLEEVGPALQEGKRYTLAISRAWLDATGTPLKQSFEKKFTVTASDREAPDLSDWNVTSPRSASRDPLKIDFSDPMDHALALRMIRVEHIAGTPMLINNEKTWIFTPDQPWKPGRHRLLVQTTIEDLAGNNIGKPFEVDLFSDVQKRITRETVSREFTVK